MKKLVTVILAATMAASLAVCESFAAETAAGATTAGTTAAAVELKPIDAFSSTQEIGSHSVTFETIVLDQPVYCKNTSKVGACYRDGKVYVAANDKITVYDVTGTQGVLANSIDYKGAEKISVGKDGTMYLNGGVFGVVPIAPDGTEGSKVNAKGWLKISPDGSYGLTFFSGRKEITKTSVKGNAVEETDKFPFAEFEKMYCTRPDDDKIVVGGKMTDDGKNGIAVYDTAGNLQYKVNKVPCQNNYIDVYATDNGVIGVTPSTIGLGDKDGTVFDKVKIKDFANAVIWPFAIMEAEDGSLIIAGSVYQTTGEIVLMRMTGF